MLKNLKTLMNSLNCIWKGGNDLLNKQMNKTEKISLAGTLMLLYYALSFPLAIEYMIGIFLGICMIVFSCKLRIKVCNTMILLIAFSSSYFILESFLNYSMYKSITYSISIVILFIIGYNWGNNLIDKYRISIMFAIKIIYIAMAVYVLLCTLFAMFQGMSSLITNRSPIVFWDGTQGVSTHFGTISAVPMAMGCYGAFKEKGKWRILNISITILVLLTNMLISNRASILFFLLFMLVSIMIYNKNKRMNNRINLVIIILGMLILGYLFYDINLFGIQDIFMKIPVFERAQTLNEIGYEDPRLERQIYVLQNFFKYRNGGGKFNAEIGEVHNVWLDIYDYSGLLPFLLFLIFTLVIVKAMMKAYNNSSFDKISGYLFMLLFAFFISFAMEPVFRSCEDYTVLFFFSCGLLLNYNKSNIFYTRSISEVSKI